MVSTNRGITFGEKGHLVTKQRPKIFRGYNDLEIVQKTALLITNKEEYYFMRKEEETSSTSINECFANLMLTNTIECELCEL